MDASFSLSGLPAGMPQQKLSPMVQRLSQERLPAGEVDENKVDPKVRTKLHKAAQDFEANFVSQMFSQMFESVPIDETFGGGRGEEMFRSLLVNEYGKQVASRGGLGIADSVYRELLRAQEARP